MQLFHFLGFAPLRKSNINHEWDITSANLLQAALFPWTHSAASFLHSVMLFKLFLPPIKPGFLTAQYTDVFLAAENPCSLMGQIHQLVWHVLGAKGKEWSCLRHQSTTIKSQTWEISASASRAAPPSSALFSLQSCLFSISSQADSQLEGQESCYLPRVTILWCITSRICLGEKGESLSLGMETSWR